MTVARAVAKAAKAVVAGGIALAGGMATATIDGHLSQPELWTVLGVTLSAVGAVYGVANAKEQPRRGRGDRPSPIPED